MYNELLSRRSAWYGLTALLSESGERLTNMKDSKNTQRRLKPYNVQAEVKR
jgi:hypothetical protein